MCSLNHIALATLNLNSCHSYEPYIGGQSPDVHRTAQLSHIFRGLQSAFHVFFTIVYTNQRG
jgi:hypothetical protein